VPGPPPGGVSGHQAPVTEFPHPLSPPRQHWFLRVPVAPFCQEFASRLGRVPFSTKATRREVGLAGMPNPPPFWPNDARCASKLTRGDPSPGIRGRHATHFGFIPHSGIRSTAKCRPTAVHSRAPRPSASFLPFGTQGYPSIDTRSAGNVGHGSRLDVPSFTRTPNITLGIRPPTALHPNPKTAGIALPVRGMMVMAENRRPPRVPRTPPGVCPAIGRP